MTCPSHFVLFFCLEMMTEHCSVLCCWLYAMWYFVWGRSKRVKGVGAYLTAY